MQDEAPSAGTDARDADRRAAQDAAAELTRMGIDPGVLGLDALPATPPDAVPVLPGPPASPATPALPVLSSFPASAPPLPPDAIGRPPAPPEVAATGRARVEPTESSWFAASPAPASPPPLDGPDPNYSGRVLVTLPGLGENDEPRRVWGYQPPPVEQPRVLSEQPHALSEPLPIPPPGPYTPPSQPTVTYPEPSLSRPLGSGQDAVWAAASVPPAAAPVDVAAVQATLQRSADRYDDMVPAGWQRTVRAVTLGLLTPGSAAGVDSERELVAKVRARRREPSVTAFLAGKGGMGTTTVAAGVGLTLAALRNDTTALVDLHRGPALLGRRLAGRTAATLSQLADTPPDDDPPELLRVGGALAIVDAGAWHTPVTVAQTARALQLLRSAYSFTLADIGNDHGEAGQATLDKADGVVVVTTSSQDAVLSAHVALERIRTAAPQLLPRVTVALVSLSERQHRRTARRLRDQLRLAIHRIVPVPFDPMLAAGSAVDVTRLRPSTREAFVRLAAFVVDPVSSVDIPAQRFRAGSAQVTP